MQLKSLLNKKISAVYQNIGWVSLSEFGTRFSRLFTAFILARTLTPSEFGAAAIVLTASQFTRILTKNGIADAIIQAKDEELANVCQTAWILNWITGLTLFFIQLTMSFFLSNFYEDDTIRLPVIIMGLTYLIYPFAYVQTALVRKKGNFRLFGITGLIQVSVDNLLTAFLALCGMGMWSIVLPKLLVSPLWVLIILSGESWRGAYTIELKMWKKLLKFSVKVLLIELTAFFRESIDYLIVGKVLSIESLGIYYFAFNSGLGLSMSLIRSLTTTIYTDFCNTKSRIAALKIKFIRNTKAISATIIPLISTQIVLAPVYVPLLYGEKWMNNGGIDILILICISGLTRPYSQMSGMLFRSIEKPEIDLYWNIIFTLLLTISIIVFSPFGIQSVALTVLFVHLIAQPLYYLYTYRFIALNSNS